MPVVYITFYNTSYTRNIFRIGSNIGGVELGLVIRLTCQRIARFNARPHYQYNRNERLTFEIILTTVASIASPDFHIIRS